jgi:hypothetical protein
MPVIDAKPLQVPVTVEYVNIQDVMDGKNSTPFSVYLNEGYWMVLTPVKTRDKHIRELLYKIKIVREDD